MDYLLCGNLPYPAWKKHISVQNLSNRRIRRYLVCRLKRPEARDFSHVRLHGQTKDKLKKFVNNFSFTEENVTAEIKSKTIDNGNYLVTVRDGIHNYEVETTKEEYDNAEIGGQLSYYTVSCPDIKYYYDERPTRGIHLNNIICMRGTDANKLKEQEKSIIRSEYSELVKNKVFVYWPKALITGICSSFVGIATLIVVTIAYTDDWKWEYINGKPVNGKDEY